MTLRSLIPKRSISLDLSENMIARMETYLLTSTFFSESEFIRQAIRDKLVSLKIKQDEPRGKAPFRKICLVLPLTLYEGINAYILDRDIGFSGFIRQAIDEKLKE